MIANPAQRVCDNAHCHWQCDKHHIILSIRSSLSGRDVLHLARAIVLQCDRRALDNACGRSLARGDGPLVGIVSAFLYGHRVGVLRHYARRYLSSTSIERNLFLIIV